MKLPLGIALAVSVSFANFILCGFGSLSPYGALVTFSGGDVGEVGTSGATVDAGGAIVCAVIEKAL